MNAILGLSHQFIQIGQFTVESRIKSERLTLEESHLILTQVHD